MTRTELIWRLHERANASTRNAEHLHSNGLHGEALLAESRAYAYRLAAEDAEMLDEERVP